MEESQVGDSQANGLAEGAATRTEGFTRSLRWAVEQQHGVTLDSASPAIPWLVRHASSMISRSRRGFGGRTAFELRQGKPHRKRLPPQNRSHAAKIVGKVSSLECKTVLMKFWWCAENRR